MNIAEFKKKLNKGEPKTKGVKFTEFKFRGKKYKISENLRARNWHEAKKKCEELGGELPEIWLLTAINKEKELRIVKGSFKKKEYWSGNECQEPDAWAFDFLSGTSNYSNKEFLKNFKCLKEIK